ncbi:MULTISPECIES: response regulator [Vibrio]|jgi:response regulator of citrate/malate metabolism|uniref:Transcriptional regulatory protein n=1 Tax=Vibrio diazotrophicus TaxID=685 RepID=A0A2J8H1T1_VIBDI|nr:MULTISPECIES: response regulator [Vibrio]MCF7362062.1 response regulator [Vibrio sp. A1-b2]MCZ4370304.1 response regulator [Vibrio diazotrophicus]PNH92210.1 response regulator [Vibrio diazotrophicus]PNH97296.1 response regulator [Vibrio diazotrophicus]PNI06796.1 response regulator [Vibrio diazotrophicus]
MFNIPVLIVEDIKEMSSMLSEHISGLYPYQVIGIAPTIAEAKVMINHLKPALIILDNFLPDGTGLDLLKYLRAKDNPVDVIFVTAANDSQTAVTTVRYGAFDYLLKPFSLEQVTDSLERYFEFNRSVYIEKGENINQSFVKRIYNTHLNSDSMTKRPKGIDSITLQRVLEAFDDGESYTSVDISEKTTISRTTARRYLEYATNIGQLVADIEYGKVGRPQRVFRKVYNKQKG